MKLIKQLITIIIIYIIIFIAFNQTNEDIINNSVLWLFIWPMAWTITIYLIILMVNMKRAYKRNKTVYMYDMDSLQNKIQRLELDNKNYYEKIYEQKDELKVYQKFCGENEIVYINGKKCQIVGYHKKTKELEIEFELNTTSNIINEDNNDNLINSNTYKLPFNEINDITEELHTHCDRPMRETKCFWICDICKKRVKKEIN